MGKSKYEKYRTTDISWLKEIPEHWIEVDTKRCFHFPKNIVGDDFLNYKVLSLSVNGVIFRDMESRMGKHHSDMGTYQIIKPNSIVLCLFDMDVTPRIVGHSDKTGIITSAYTNIIPKKNVDSKYYYYYYLLQDYNNYLFSQGTGIRTTLTRTQFGALKIALPPKQEQTTIANFLDYKTEKINRFITKKKQLIELLNEQKAAIINQAVTKGINPNVPMKESGIEWLGEIPEHWEVRKLKYVAKIYTGKTPKIENSTTDYFKNGTINWFTPGDFNKNGFLKESQRKITEEAVIDNNLKLFPKNSTYLISIGGTIGKVGFCSDKAFSNQQINAISFNQSIDPLFGFCYLKNSKIQVDVLADFTTLPILNQAKCKKLIISFSQDIREQQEIVNFINKESDKIDKTISTIEKEISLVEEYKTALIAEAVTGKIDVRDFKILTTETPLAMVAEEAANYNKETN